MSDLKKLCVGKSPDFQQWVHMGLEKLSASTTQETTPQKITWTKLVLFSSIWIVIILVAFEVFLRFFISGVSPESYFSPDFGPRPVGGSIVKYVREGSGTIRYSDFGEIATPYQGGPGVVVFGDSQTASYQVNDYQNYVSVAEQVLYDRGVNVDLRNFGYPAGTLADYAYLASITTSEMNADVVVIQTSLNDFLGIGGREGYVLSSIGNYFQKNEDGTITLVHKPIKDNNAFYKPLITKSALLSASLDRLRLFRTVLNNSFGKQKDAGDANMIDPAVMRVSQSEKFLENYKAQITALHEAYKGQKVVIVYLPFVPSIVGDEVTLENKDSDLLLEVINQFDDWYVVDPSDEFRNLWLEQKKLPRGFTNSEPGTGHLNVDGQAIVGRLLAEKIAEAVQ